jgi:hypothetical protein
MGYDGDVRKQGKFEGPFFELLKNLKFEQG